MPLSFRAQIQLSWARARAAALGAPSPRSPVSMSRCWCCFGVACTGAYLNNPAAALRRHVAGAVTWRVLAPHIHRPTAFIADVNVPIHLYYEMTMLPDFSEYVPLRVKSFAALILYQNRDEIVCHGPLRRRGAGIRTDEH